MESLDLFSLSLAVMVAFFCLMTLVLVMSRKAGNFFKLSLSKQARGILLIIITGEAWEVSLYLSRMALLLCEVLLGLYLSSCERNSELTLPFPCSYLCFGVDFIALLVLCSMDLPLQLSSWLPCLPLYLSLRGQEL